METFDGEFRARRPEDKTPDEIQDRLSFLIAARTPEMDGYLLSPASTLPSRVGEIAHLGVYRVVELAESAIREMNRRRAVSSCLLVRGAFETACLVYELMRRVEEFTEGNDSTKIGPLDDFVNNTLLGSKSKEFFLFEEFTSVNVLTHIQKLSKTLDVPLEGYYDRLSEYCHPNSHGMIGLYAIRHNACVAQFAELNDKAERGAMTWCVNALAVALGLMEEGLKQWLKASDKLAVLAEKHIFDRGSWPKDTPYPVTPEMREWLRAEAIRLENERSSDKP